MNTDIDANTLKESDDKVTAESKSLYFVQNTVALKSIKGSNEISIEYLRELEIYYNLTINNASLPFYGITKDPNSSEFMMVTTLAEQGSLRSLLAEGFTKLRWKIGKINDDAAKRIKEDFDIADKEIPNVQSLFKGNSENSNFKYVSKQIDYSSVIKTSLYGDIDSGLMEFNLSDNFGEGNEDDGEDND
ncbi:unnamed protein product [Rhizophagus irregularis]|nr:unnamed protein product [Rhizophagus irregularis]